jgi:hypothetical protein
MPPSNLRGKNVIHKGRLNQMKSKEERRGPGIEEERNERNKVTTST